MSATEARLAWIQQAPKPADMYAAECGMYVFEISKTTDRGYVLEMWQTCPEDWPLLVWEMDGFSLEEAKARAERLADQHVPVIMEG